MTDTGFVNTMVRRSVEKGTRIIKEPSKKPNWAGKEFKKFQKEKQEPLGNSVLSSSKGTGKILLGNMPETQIPSLKGRRIVTNRGTNSRVG